MAAKLFCGVNFDMNQFADCMERGAQSATELYNQELVHGTRGAERFCCLFILNLHSYFDRFYTLHTK